MKVLLANKFFFRNGGSEVVMFQERDFLLRAGHQVVDFAMDDDRNMESPYSSFFVSPRDYRGKGGALQKLKSTIAFVHSSEAVRKISALIEKTQPDLVHCHNIYHQLTPSIIGAAKARGIPVVLTLHDSKVVCPAYTRLRWGKPCSDCLEGDFSHVVRHRCAEGSFVMSALLYAEAVVQRHLGSYESVDRFIAPSRFMADSITRRIPADRIALIPNGISLPDTSACGCDNGYVLYLGRLSSEKGVQALLTAHTTSGARWPLLIAGTGPLHDQLKVQYPQAQFVGHLSGDILQQTLASASIVVVPSECYENCPMAILEAMAYGKPVVGSRMGGIPELVVDGETGLLFDAGNVEELSASITGLMGTPDRRSHMGRNARARVEREYSLEGHNANLMGIYESILRQDGSVTNLRNRSKEPNANP
jgi:glycosyltransferase involved in cell wall biosynthesis